MPDELEKKIQLLRNQYTFEDDQKWMQGLLNKYRENKLLKDLKKFDGIKMLLADIETEIKNITTLLAWDKNMAEEQRKIVFTKRETYLWFVNFFKNPDTIIKNIEKQVNEEFKT